MYIRGWHRGLIKFMWIHFFFRYCSSQMIKNYNVCTLFYAIFKELNLLIDSYIWWVWKIKNKKNSLINYIKIIIIFAQHKKKVMVKCFLLVWKISYLFFSFAYCDLHWKKKLIYVALKKKKIIYVICLLRALWSLHICSLSMRISQTFGTRRLF